MDAASAAKSFSPKNSAYETTEFCESFPTAWNEGTWQEIALIV